MKHFIYTLFLLLLLSGVSAQENNFTVLENNPSTNVKNQFASLACWDYACTSMTESELLKSNNVRIDLSEAFTVYNTYIDKATKYINTRGRTFFNKGGIGEDVLNIIDKYGAMPEEIYPGIGRDTIMNNEALMYPLLKAYLDSILSKTQGKITLDWRGDFIKILDKYIGAPNETFLYNGKWHTSKTFAAEYIKDKSTDFIGLTSFTDHPYYTSFIIDETHNYNGKTYSNLPLSEFIETVKTSIANGYTLIWDTDITNAGFQNTKGFAMWVNSKSESNMLPDFTEKPYNKKIRQQLYDRGITQDDHLMQITGLAKDPAGKEFFIVKNSWGNLGPFNGYIYVSVPYFAINTISVLVNKKALPAAITSKLSLFK